MPKIKYPYEFDPEKRRAAKTYRREKMVLYFVSMFVSLATVLFILFSGLHIAIRDAVSQFPLSTQLYGFLILLVFTATSFPVSFYSNYLHDRKFKLIRYTLLGWLKDWFKMNLVYYLLSLAVITLLYFSIRSFSPWWTYAGAFYIVFLVAMNYVYPFIIVPFMWKIEPYKDARMKKKILGLCRKIGVMNIRNVVVIKESEKSIRPNAVFMGMGNSKRIGLFDTLLDSFTKDEVEAVVGHELGHYVNKDVLRGLAIEAAMIFPVLVVIDYMVGAVGPIFGIGGIGDLASLPLIGAVNGLIGFFMMPLLNTHSRWRESEADRFALEHVKKPLAQVSTEKRLADMHLSELKVHPLIEFWLFTHPSTIRRIRMAEKWKNVLRK